MQPLPGLALVWVGKSREFSCSCVFKELQNALQHLSALWFPQVCEVCVCLPESYNYLWESNLWKHSRGKKTPGLVNPSMVSSSCARRSPQTEPSLIVPNVKASRDAGLSAFVPAFLDSRQQHVRGVLRRRSGSVSKAATVLEELI